MYNLRVIKNKTRKTVIAENVSRKNIFNKSLGLLGKKSAEAIMFKTRFGIHTFGLRFPIDVIILNKNGEIVALKKRMKANRIFLWNPRFDTVIELPADTIEKSKTEKGDIIEASL